MNRPAARKLANVILLCAGAAAVSALVTVPPLRRVALGRWLGAGVSTFLLAQVLQAWRESARDVRPPAGSRPTRAGAPAGGPEARPR